MYQAKILGELGATVITNTTAVTPTYPFYAVTVLSDAVFASLSGQNIDGQALTGFTVPAGTTIFGAFGTVQLTSGKVICYKSKL